MSTWLSMAQLKKYLITECKVEPQWLINVAFGAAGAFGMWILNRLNRSVEKIEDNINEMPHRYVTAAQYQRDIDEIKFMLSKIFDRLESKADK
jgi:hypothetical protein